MKVIYTIANPYGLGADRWIYEGYREAFSAEGHDFITLTEADDFREGVASHEPDLLFLDFAAFERISNHDSNYYPPEMFQELKGKGTKILCLIGVGFDKEQDVAERIEFFRRYVRYFDACVSTYALEATKGFEESFGKKLYLVYHAADTSRYFPEEPDERFKCDIAFVGSYYTQKKAQFEQLLFPLFQKYKVRLYGPGWTQRDKVLRIVNGLSRRLKTPALTRFINDQRVTITPDNERKLYASAKICINIHEYYMDGTPKGFSNEREFKIPACGGFQLSDWIPGMHRYFDIGKEIIATKTPEEWFASIDYYLRNEKERKEIQERGTARVLKEHTYRHRVKQLIDICSAF